MTFIFSSDCLFLVLYWRKVEVIESKPLQTLLGFKNKNLISVWITQPDTTTLTWSLPTSDALCSLQQIRAREVSVTNPCWALEGNGAVSGSQPEPPSRPNRKVSNFAPKCRDNFYLVSEKRLDLNLELFALKSLEKRASHHMWVFWSVSVVFMVLFCSLFFTRLIEVVLIDSCLDLCRWSSVHIRVWFSVLLFVCLLSLYGFCHV